MRKKTQVWNGALAKAMESGNGCKPYSRYHTRQQALKCALWTVPTILLLLAGAGGWWRYSTQTSLHAAEVELRTAVEQKPLADRGISMNRRPAVCVLPARYTALCTAHKLWLLSPAEIKIPLVCGELAWEGFLLSPWGWYDPQTHLDQLVVPLRPSEYLEEPDPLRRTPHPGETVALATPIDYAVATYGRGRLPMLVAGLGHYDRWETLIPAVYGVSSADFEAGWQAYLTAHYGGAVKLPSKP